MRASPGHGPRSKKEADGICEAIYLKVGSKVKHGCWLASGHKETHSCWGPRCKENWK